LRDELKNKCGGYMHSCKICDNTQGNKTHTAREMLFGLREKFEYLECGDCGCLQIVEIPKDLSKYYPDNYHPFHDIKILKDSYLKSRLKIQLAKYCLHGKRYVLGWLLSNMFDYGFLSKIRNLGIGLKTNILDIGSGGGRILIYLRKHGFENLTGVDPFIKDNIFYSNGVKIFKKDFYEIDEQYEFIMLNHSFEHMPDPLSVLKKLYQIILPGKYVLIRIPVADCYPWKKYNVNWVALDAPRHLFIHTKRSMRILAQMSGFQLARIFYDSNEKQFWGSEQYLRDIPLIDDRSYFKNPNNSIFTKRQIKEFKDKTIELNKNNEGDAACFYLYKPSD
jgi:SAM-dependent methyltransferase